MRKRWLVVLGCLLITACSDTTTQDLSKNQSKPDTVESKDDAGSIADPQSTSDVTSEPTSDPTPEPEAEPKTDPSDPPETETTEESLSGEARFEAAESRFNDARDKFMQEYRAAAEADREKLVQDKLPQPADFAEEFLAIADDHPDESVGFRSLFWVASNVQSGASADKAFDRLFADHMDQEEMKDLCQSLAYSMPAPKTSERLEQLIEKSPHDSVKASATFFLANYLRSVASAKPMLDQFKSQLDQEQIDYIRDFEPPTELIETLYQTLIDEYASYKPNPRSAKNYKEMAESAIFEMNYLTIGKVAPDIEGEDLDGSEFKLSDYRGKVVLLDFWGDW